MTGQHDWQDKRLTGQLSNQSRHCPLTGHYFKPWSHATKCGPYTIKVLHYTAIRYILITTENDWSTWLARQKVDRSTLQSVQTLSIDWPLFQALVPCNQVRPIHNPTTYGRQTKEQGCALTAPSGPLYLTHAPGWLEYLSFLILSNCYMYAAHPEI